MQREQAIAGFILREPMFDFVREIVKPRPLVAMVSS
jgi:hypothetical protein